MERIPVIETTENIDKKVTVAGWIANKRDHGKITFVDLRDASGVLQVVFSSDLKKAAVDLRPEWVIEITGKVSQRPKSMENPELETGSIELQAENVEVLSKAKTPPFALDTDGYEVDEEKRLKYRYLDLRRPRLQRNLRLRHKVLHFMRDYLSKEGFVEIETPILTKSTPEGARDFIVPARLQHGKFYALPQSPQQYKQLLQVAGFEKYFQIARALRDEDPRGDRQAEHTQLDIEMSYIEREDILSLVEKLHTKLVKELFPEKKITKTPFPRYTYKEVIKKYKTDKPDLRKNTKDDNELAFAWVVDFPAYEKEKKTGRWTAMHNPFSRPQADSPKVMKKNPGKILSEQYDLVLNGMEIAGGSLRAFRPELLEAAFEIMGHSKKEIKENFGHMLEAFTYGVPPHGGIAGGVDRLLAILLNEPNIREVMAFPKTGDNRELMMDAPSEVSKEQLKELGLKIEKKKK
ncbi:MAG TPA: aspartate--tRNA ligase [Candidatus Wildermuthbacteria bacterium]|nr:aspartate--tRNA ligase [Candidatus Wildermuthbacteria bacterium]